MCVMLCQYVNVCTVPTATVMSRVLSCRYSAHSFYVLAINNSFVGLAYDPSEPSIR